MNFVEVEHSAPIREFATLIKQRADELCKEGLDEDTATIRALAYVLDRLAYPAPDPHDVTLLEMLASLGRSGRTPVTTKRLAVETGRELKTVNFQLKRLEERNLVNRPWGQKSGWAVVL